MFDNNISRKVRAEKTTMFTDDIAMIYVIKGFDI